jgi:hypothetical protein
VRRDTSEWFAIKEINVPLHHTAFIQNYKVIKWIFLIYKMVSKGPKYIDVADKVLLEK